MGKKISERPVKGEKLPLQAGRRRSRRTRRPISDSVPHRSESVPDEIRRSACDGRREVRHAGAEHDVVIDRGEVRKRKKKPSKKFRDAFGHSLISMEEKLTWNCRRLVVGTGAYGGLPVMKEVKIEADRRKIELLILPTVRAIETLKQEPDETNAILHVTC